MNDDDAIRRIVAAGEKVSRQQNKNGSDFFSSFHPSSSPYLNCFNFSKPTVAAMDTAPKLEIGYVDGCFDLMHSGTLLLCLQY